MKLYKKIVLGLIGTAVLGGTIYGGRIAYKNVRRMLETAEEEAQRNETTFIQAVSNFSPFNKPPIEEMQEQGIQKEWYNSFAFAEINKNDIVYEENGSLYLAKNKDKEQAVAIANDIVLNENYLFAAGNKDNPDIYWVDDEMNLRKLKNKNGEFAVSTDIVHLKNYFKRIPKHFGLGDLNLDGHQEFIYGSQINFGYKKKNAIKAMTSNGNSMHEWGPVYYLGNEELKGLIVKDMDEDGDIDLMFKLEGKDTVFGLENKVKKQKNADLFMENMKKFR